MKPILITLFFLLVAIAAAILGGGYFVFIRACRREKELPWQDPGALSTTMWAPMAGHIQDCFQWLQKHHAKDVTLQSDDGLNLHGLWVPATDPLGTLILFHGYRSCPQADFSVVLDFYHRLGFQLLLPDQRSHGKSQGRYITFGIWEHRDALRWVQWHNATVGPQNVYLCGMSMGSTTVLLAAGEGLPENVCGVVADCGFTSPYEIISREVRKETHLPPRLLVSSANLFAKILGKFDFRENSTVSAMKKCKVPVLFVHGTGDHFVPCAMTKAAYDACASEKQLIMVEGAGHGLSYVVNQPRCQSALETFFMSHLAK